MLASRKKKASLDARKTMLYIKYMSKIKMREQKQTKKKGEKAVRGFFMIPEKKVKRSIFFFFNLSATQQRRKREQKTTPFQSQVRKDEQQNRSNKEKKVTKKKHERIATNACQLTTTENLAHKKEE